MWYNIGLASFRLHILSTILIDPLSTQKHHDIPPTPFRIIFLYCSSLNVRLWLYLIYKSREFLSSLTNLTNLINFNSYLLCILRLFCVYREITSSTLSMNFYKRHVSTLKFDYFKDTLVVNLGNSHWGIWLYQRFGHRDTIVRSLTVSNTNNLTKNWFDCFHQFLFVAIRGFANHWAAEKFEYLEDLLLMVVKLMFLSRDISFHHFLREQLLFAS